LLSLQFTRGQSAEGTGKETLALAWLTLLLCGPL